MFPFLFFFADYIIFLFKACQNIILTFYSLIKSLPPLIQDLNLIIYFASRSSLPRIKRHTYTYQNIYAKLSFCCILIRFPSVSDKHKIWVLFLPFLTFDKKENERNSWESTNVSLKKRPWKYCTCVFQ